MPSTVAGRPLVIWSVAGDNFWSVASRGNARSVASPRLAAAGLNPDALALAVAGRADTRDPPYIIWAVQFGDHSGHGLPPIASALLFGVMRVDGSQGEELRQVEIEGTVIAVGNSQMVRQDRHHRGGRTSWLAPRPCTASLPMMMRGRPRWCERSETSKAVRDARLDLRRESTRLRELTAARGHPVVDPRRSRSRSLCRSGPGIPSGPRHWRSHRTLALRPVRSRSHPIATGRRSASSAAVMPQPIPRLGRELPAVPCVTREEQAEDAESPPETRHARPEARQRSPLPLSAWRGRHHSLRRTPPSPGE